MEHATDRASARPPCLLIVAGNDPSGGAGLCADIQTATLHGVHPMPVAASLTVQNTIDVSRVQDVAPEMLEAQIDCLLQDVPVSAVKLGLLGTPDLVRVVADALDRLPGVPVVLDPVLKAGGGGRLAGHTTARALVDALLPRVTVATPNRFELAQLCPGADGDWAAAATRLAAASGARVLVTGADEAAGRGLPTVENFAAGPDGRLRRWSWPRLPGRFHGSGCTLAAALASALARGRTLDQALDHAQRWTHEALRGGFLPGSGQHIPRRMVE